MTIYVVKFSSGVYKIGKIFAETSTYRKIPSSNTSHLEAHAGFFRLLMKGMFDPYVL